MSFTDPASEERYVLLQSYRREFASNDVDREVFQAVSLISGEEIEGKGTGR